MDSDKETETHSKAGKIIMRKSYWILLTVSSVVIVFVFAYFMKQSLERTAITLVATLLLIGFAAYTTFNPSTTVDRALFVGIGAAVIGFVLWAALMLFLNATGLRWQIADLIGDAFFAFISLIICWALGAFIGDWIGKQRNYKFPRLTF